MVVVAVVGGTGSVGKTIVDAFKEDGKHKVIVLARKVGTHIMPYPHCELLTSNRFRKAKVLLQLLLLITTTLNSSLKPWTQTMSTP
jgi:aspartate-semialdehyde dehydrogenase